MNFKSFVSAGVIAALTLPTTCLANYSCSGAVNYVGIDGGGNVVVAVGNTPLHTICSVVSQGAFSMAVPVCKAAYASFVAARLAGKNMTIYYNDNGLTCTTFSPWTSVPANFVAGPE